MIATSTALAAAAVASIAAAGISAYGMYSQGQAQKKMAEYNAEVAANAAKSSQMQGQAEAERIRDRNARVAGAQRASFLSSGVTISGSASDVMYDSALEGELDAMMAIYRGDIGANQANSQAELSRMQGRAAQSASMYNATGTLLTGVGNSLGYYGEYKAEKLKQSNPTLMR